MEIKTIKDIVLQKKFLKYSSWEKLFKRSLYNVKSSLLDSNVKIAPFDFKKWENVRIENSLPPEKTGWEPFWHGYWEMEKTFSQEHRDMSEKISNCDKGLSVQEFRKQCFLSVVDAIKDSQINMFELGAGNGRRCLELAGVVDFNLIPSVKDKNYRCLAIEAEPTHYGWIVEHFKKQNINGEAVHGAISDKSGYVGFDASLDPSTFYGQTVVEGGEYKVKSFTVDELVKKYNYSKVNIIHSDVQGSELKAILGAEKSIKQGLIDYWFISTHERYLEDEIMNFTRELYDVILYIPRRSGLFKHNFYGWVPVPQDGLLILRNKKLSA